MSSGTASITASSSDPEPRFAADRLEPDRHRAGQVQTEQSSRTGDGLKFIDLVIHEVQDVGLWKEATNVEFYGSPISDNRWNAPDRGHGHGLYVQNREDTKPLTPTGPEFDVFIVRAAAAAAHSR